MEKTDSNEITSPSSEIDRFELIKEKVKTTRQEEESLPLLSLSNKNENVATEINIENTLQ